MGIRGGGEAATAGRTKGRRLRHAGAFDGDSICDDGGRGPATGAYPAGKNDLIDQAKKNDAPPEVIDVLERFGGEECRSPTEVSQEFDRVAEQSFSCFLPP
ncbi:DUF2795 domain-containing protein [Methanoculleus sp. FWC-SCC1]|uniref:DUF2795 domain-containing protein n=1 Tax=Methanoculleus frigidifontis TaxID=2584085 RepID=A0ABT8MD23_9EURY|nr:DUF2795 domain-containing protein [Methanoculleus sp. FWC-SCC1]MDN7025843.1 DUF2795 domain-containing protein [Methanoculleus sp. FWC-SCC1]